MINRIIFIVEIRFNLRNYRRFGIELLKQNGFKVEVWDATPILNPKLFRDYVPPDIFEYNELVLFTKAEELNKRL